MGAETASQILVSVANMTKKKDKVYTDQQRLFLDSLPVVKGDIRAAMNIAGYSENTPERYIIEALHEEIVEIANKLLAANAVKASMSLVEVLDEKGNKQGHSNMINSAKQILDRAGVVAKDSAVNIKVGGDLFFLPAKTKEGDDDGQS